ncbi:MAG: hypothetical protein H0T90_08360 [Gemmatimonadales bacterium]|nr:hypothetical protein [Gemmatimonadales bacterium]
MSEPDRCAASAWSEHATQLADFTRTWLVNRGDVWGQYGPFIDQAGAEHQVRTAPPKWLRGTLRLDRAHLVAHYRAVPHRRIGLHSTSAENTCRWGAFDVDLHDNSPPHVTAEAFAVFGDGAEGAA